MLVLELIHISKGAHGVYYHLQFDCSVNNSFKRITNKHYTFALSALCESGFTSRRMINAKCCIYVIIPAGPLTQTEVLYANGFFFKQIVMRYDPRDLFNYVEADFHIMAQG